jgi:hypothetical protein
MTPSVTTQDPKGFPKPFGSDSSALCLACGLRCDGVLHANVVVMPDESERVCALGLTGETLRDGLGFRQPCPLCRNRRLSSFHLISCRFETTAPLPKY